MGQKIAQLEARKRAAVEKEDYDTAKLIKADIDKLRAAGESAAGAMEIASRNKDPNEIFGRVLRVSGSGQAQAGGGGQASPPAMARQPSYQPPAEASTVEDYSLPPLAAEPSGAGGMSGDIYAGGRNSYADQSSKFATSYDERPALGKGRYTPTGAGLDAGLEGADPPASDNGCDIPPPAGGPGGLPGPEPLPGKDAKEAEAIEELAGEYCARAMFGKNWQLREASYNYAAGQVR